MNSTLDQEEREILNSYENDEWIPIENPSDIERYKTAAKNTFKKNKRINIRVTEMDLDRLQERACIEGLPYQTLMSSVLHKYATGRLIEKNA